MKKKKIYGKIRLKRLRIKKRSKKIQIFTPEKIQKAIMKTGGNKELASQTTRNIVNKILHKSQIPLITFKNVAKEVIEELKKKNKKVAKTFENNMGKKNGFKKRKVYKQKKPTK